MHSPAARLLAGTRGGRPREQACLRTVTPSLPLRERCREDVCIGPAPFERVQSHDFARSVYEFLHVSGGTPMDALTCEEANRRAAPTAICVPGPLPFDDAGAPLFCLGEGDLSRQHGN